jgi:hypothetical protein
VLLNVLPGPLDDVAASTRGCRTAAGAVVEPWSLAHVGAGALRGLALQLPPPLLVVDYRRVHLHS